MPSEFPSIVESAVQELPLSFLVQYHPPYSHAIASHGTLEALLNRPDLSALLIWDQQFEELLVNEYMFRTLELGIIECRISRHWHGRLEPATLSYSSRSVGADGALSVQRNDLKRIVDRIRDRIRSKLKFPVWKQGGIVAKEVGYTDGVRAYFDSGGTLAAYGGSEPYYFLSKETSLTSGG